MSREHPAPPAPSCALRATALLGLAACQQTFIYEGAFDMPSGAAVLQPETGGPFDQPVGFVANGVGGNIIPLDLKYGRFLTLEPTASFLRTNWLPTGQARALADVAVYAPDPGTVTLFASDRAFATLLRVPVVVGTDEDGFPQPGWIDEAGELHRDPIVVGEPESFGSGGARISNIEVKTGYTSTETWTVAFEPSRGTWIVTGSRSGLQEDEVLAGQRFVGDRRRLAFDLTGQGQPGDRFEIVTDNGVRELDVGGLPTELAMAPDQSTLAMTVGSGEQTFLRFFDPATEVVAAEAPLAADAHPGRLAWAPDGAALFVADNARSAVWEVSPDGAAATEHALPFPTSDMAPLYGDWGRLLYVVPVDALSVWLYDLDAQALVDLNAAAPGVQGMPFASPVIGVEPLPIEHLYREEDEQGVRLSGQSVAVSLHEGKVVFMKEETGCLLEDPFGPRTVVDGSLGAVSDVTTNFSSVPFGAFMEYNATNDRHVAVSACAGLAQDETWNLRFDRLVGGWIVEGTQTGEQEAIAFEDERYLSDLGEVSFVVRAGSVPSQDGWTMTFAVDDGVLEAEGDNDGDGTREIPLDVPGDPVFFHYTVGPTDGAWSKFDDRAFVLTPGQGSDVVGRVNPQEGSVELLWD